jgi:hypothetical protein
MRQRHALRLGGPDNGFAAADTQKIREGGSFAGPVFWTEIVTPSFATSFNLRVLGALAKNLHLYGPKPPKIRHDNLQRPLYEGG